MFLQDNFNMYYLVLLKNLAAFGREQVFSAFMDFRQDDNLAETANQRPRPLLEMNCVLR